jgi:hypothetical protein
MNLTAGRLRRGAELGAALAGLVHLAAPGRLLATARWGYDTVLAVEFRPRDPAVRRVRLLGLCFLLVAVLSARLRRAD